MEFDPPIELRKRFEELTANPDGVEPFKDELLTPDEFSKVFRKAAKQFGDNLELAGSRPPLTTRAVSKYPEGYMHYLQRRHQFTWGRMIGFLDEWRQDQADEMQNGQRETSA